jgi:hypothetical protein
MGFGRADPDRRQLAHPSLARTHRRGSVALQGFDVIEAFADRILQVFRSQWRSAL